MVVVGAVSVFYGAVRHHCCSFFHLFQFPSFGEDGQTTIC